MKEHKKRSSGMGGMTVCLHVHSQRHSYINAITRAGAIGCVPLARFGDARLDGERVKSPAGVAMAHVRVQLHVEARKVELAEHGHACQVASGLDETLDQVVRDRVAGVDVARDGAQRGRLVAKVLHELRRQLDRIPLDTRDASHSASIHVGQHVLSPESVRASFTWGLA